MNKHSGRRRPGLADWRTQQAYCNRRPTEKEVSLADAGFDHIEVTVLEVARYFWQTFALPETQSWLSALQRAELGFRGPHGADIGLEILATVQAMRTSRSSCFSFNDPRCKGCSAILSEHERQFMGVFRAVRDDRPGQARTHAMVLCEGNDTDALIGRMAELVRVTYQDQAKRPTSPLATPLH